MSSTDSAPTPASRKPVRIGVVGSGARICRVLASLLAQDRAFEITAVHDPDPRSIEELRKQLAPQARACATSDELCKRADVDWVFIGSWNCFHAAQVREAFAAGKDVFCEKPLALSIDEARAMHAAQTASGRVFALGLVLRYSPLYRAVKSMLERGLIGKLVSFEFNETLDFNHGGYIHGNWRRKREYAGTHLLEKCCHDLDLVLWLTNSQPSRVASFGGCTFFRPENAGHARRLGPSPENGRPAYRAWTDPHGIDPFNNDKDIVDHQVALIEFGDGLRASFHTNCNAALPERRFYLLGTEGALRCDAMTGRIELRRIGWKEPVEVHNITNGSSHAGGDEFMARELADVLNLRRTPAAGFPEGVRSLALAEAIDTAMDEGRVVEMDALWAGLESEFGPLFTPAPSAAVRFPA